MKPERVTDGSQPSAALLLLAAALIVVGLAGSGWALARPAPSLSDPFHVVGGAALVATLAGLLAAAWTWYRWRHDGIANQASALKLNWFHEVMSQTNRLILRRPNPRELFEGVCEVCVREGHMALVVIDLADVGEVHRATADASADGAAKHLAPLTLDASRMQNLMMLLVRRAGRPVVIDDTETDPRIDPARDWCNATGLRSLAAIPLARGGVAVGVLLLHAKTRGFFDEPLKRLLTELGADLSFALDNADRERERQAAATADLARQKAEDASLAKTEFMALMSHELRTPLNAMLGFAQLLSADADQPLLPGQADRVRLITHAGWHLLGLLNDVMDISNIESGRLEVVNVGVDISSLIDEAVALSQPLARTHRVALAERTGSPFGIGAVVDARRLKQVLLNLFGNACKYNRPGGRVQVDVTQTGSHVLIDVIDNGIGMTEAQLAALFEPFNRLGREAKAIEGSGIGLALTRRLVEKMRGQLEFDSSPAHGTRARVTLPACAIPTRTAERSPQAARVVAPAAQEAVVLYIEDDPVNQILVAQMLSRCAGVNLITADNGLTGLALANQRQPDLVLLDMNLPDMTGFEVLAALRAYPRTEFVQVVAVSANAMPADMARARELGVTDYWTKPLALDAFLTGVTTLLAAKAQARHAEPALRALPDRRSLHED